MARTRVRNGLLAALFAVGLAAAMPAQAAGEAVLEKIKVHSPSIEGNLEGDSPDREVIVVLPPSYKTSPNKRYPVVYFLHGYFAGTDAMDKLIKYQEMMSADAAKGHEFIFVAPDSYTKFAGAMYANSVTTGNFEDFIVKDLVSYVDSHYRTLAKPESRGLAGHSMGGYGTLKLAMKYPGVYSAIYALSPCCLSPRAVNVEQAQKLAAMPVEEAEKAGFGERATFAQVVAWSPNPKNPPYYADFGVKDGKPDPAAVGAWAANAPIAMLPQYVSRLKALKAIGLEVGDKDFLLGDDTAMHEALEKFSVAHDWAVFDGDHANRLPVRMRENMLGFFAKHLATR